MKLVGLSVDVDGWDTCLSFYGIKTTPSAADKEVNCGLGVRRLLDLFKKKSTKATFFLVGNTAKRFKKDIISIKKAGHEIGCHSMTHDRLKGKSVPEIEKEVSLCLNTIKRVIGSRCVGFRAPAFSVSNDLFDVLENHRFKYDSSVNPTYIPGEYGTPLAPISPYRPSKESVRKHGDRSFIELPLAVNPLVPIPLGAPFIRNFGAWWTKLGLKMLWSMNIPAVIYMHPKDVVEVPNDSPVPWYIKRNSGAECLNRIGEIIEFCKNNGAKIITLQKIAENYSKTL